MVSYLLDPKQSYVKFWVAGMDKLTFALMHVNLLFSKCKS